MNLRKRGIGRKRNGKSGWENQKKGSWNVRESGEVRKAASYIRALPEAAGLNHLEARLWDIPLKQ